MHARDVTGINNGKAGIMGSGVWIFILEGGIALGLLAFIIWWTLPRPPKDKS
jgi:hypothetical protein